jgi:general secretion pathway protein L
MSESVLARQWDRLRAAVAATPLSRFLVWWGRELYALLPARARSWFDERRDEVLLEIGPEALVVERRGRQPSPPERLERADPAALRAVLAQRVESGEEPPRVVLCLPPSRVLRRSLSLPAAAAQTLRQVLAFEMDRQTPFRADQVHYDCRIAARDEAARQIAVDLALVPRAAVDADLAALGELGVPLDAVDVREPGAERQGFNLLPADRRAVRRNLWLQVNLGLGLLVLALLGVAMWRSVANREVALAALEAASDAQLAEARGVATLRNELKTAIEGANFLVERKRARPAISDLMLDITGRLGNDTWLQRLSLNGEQLQLQGQSREAAGLITVLQQSPYLEAPALQGAITPDARSGKEQFLIQAKVRAVVAAPPAPAAAPGAADATAPAAQPPAEPTKEKPDAAAAQP